MKVEVGEEVVKGVRDGEQPPSPTMAANFSPADGAATGEEGEVGDGSDRLNAGGGCGVNGEGEWGRGGGWFE